MDKKREMTDTITAIATPIGEGGIGIVRLSGPKAIPIAAQIFRLTPHRDINKLPSHTLHYGQVIDKKKLIDEAMLAIMRTPHSYTCEDVVEIQAHGGTIPLQKILRLTINKGARLAEPGEFTRRAFINGRLDLAQAEAVADLVRARTETAYEIALGQLSGSLSEEVKALRGSLLNCLTQVEANIDFSLESGVVLGKSFEKSLKAILDEIIELERSAERGRIIREGFKAVIIGRPNVGKSSLMNALLKEKRVIVTHLPGTTRDVVEEIVNIQGIPLKIADTAGMRKTRNLIEIQSVAQSQSYLAKADLVILVLDGSQKLKKEDLCIIENILEKKKRVMVVINKIDLPPGLNVEEVKKYFTPKSIVRISAKYLSGFSILQRKLVSILGLSSTNGRENILVTRLRHQIALKKAQDELTKAIEALNEGLSGEFMAFDLWRSVDALGEIIGLNYHEDLLDEIFREFCIGK